MIIEFNEASFESWNGGATNTTTAEPPTFKLLRLFSYSLLSISKQFTKTVNE